VALTWLHLSDFHIRSGAAYDRDVVLSALVRSVREMRSAGRRPDVVFATGDIAFSGQPAEYEVAGRFFDELLDAAGLERRHLLVIPGNHDVDRSRGVGLARTLSSREEADAYFGPGVFRPQLTNKQHAFVAWYDDYFAGIREWPDTSCAMPEIVEAAGVRLGVVAINSALFCQDDHDHAKLWIGRRALEGPLAELASCDVQLRLALVHHPLEWLSDLERANVRAKLAGAVDVLLRGHLHETDVEYAVTPNGGMVQLAAGASYQTRLWPNRAMYVTADATKLRVFPIRYEDTPTEIWTVDPSVFPDVAEYTGEVPLVGRELGVESDRRDGPDAGASSIPRFKSNVPSRRGLPVVGRDTELREMAERLDAGSAGGVLALTGQPGVGKSELAREFARVAHERYPGGTFIVDAASADAPVELATLATNLLGMELPSDRSVVDRCQRALAAVSATQALIIYDNVMSFEGIEAWLPAAGAPCHVVITSVCEPRTAGWSLLEVKPLDEQASVNLVDALAGPVVAGRYGTQLAEAAGGLPVQLCPTAAVLGYELRRGHTDAPDLVELADETRSSFLFPYRYLDDPQRLLLHAATGLNPRRIGRTELRAHLQAGAAWSDRDFDQAVDACLDWHLLQGDDELTMHQLLVAFLRSDPVGDMFDGHLAGQLAEVRHVQIRRLVAVAAQVVEQPGDASLASTLMSFDLSVLTPESSAERTSVAQALLEIGQFDLARPWFEEAVEEKRLGDAHGRVDHESLGVSLHQIGHCWSSVGELERARPWYEEAVEEKRLGDVHGRVDHESLGVSLHQVGYCLVMVGEFEGARPWFEEAVEEGRLGDVHGRVDHQSLGASLHLVGYCWSSVGEFERARSWFEEAVQEGRLGDVHGRVDHQGLGASLHLVGDCLVMVGEFEGARPWFEEAVEEKRLGDVHGRVDHQILGVSLHLVGYCWSSVGEFERARPWLEEAVQEGRLGDVHGRVDHDRLRATLMTAARVFRKLGENEAAKAYEEEAGDQGGRE
jgi:tetratricopeptide (TPR) repeat protein